MMMTIMTTTMVRTRRRAISPRERTNRITNQNQTTTTPKKPSSKRKTSWSISSSLSLSSSRRILRMHVAKGALSLMACATITHGTQNASASSSYGKHFDDRDDNYIENIAGSVSSSEGDERKPTLTSKVRGKNKKKIERCTGQCVTTCVRGSFRSTSGPGLGPATILKEPFVFKDGFRSRRYCVEECLDYCALTVNKADVART